MRAGRHAIVVAAVVAFAMDAASGRAQAPIDEEAAAIALAQAQDLADNGRYAEAIASLEPFDHPNYPVFPLLIAQYSEGAGDYVRADSLFRRLLEGEYGALEETVREDAARGLSRVNERLSTVRVRVTASGGELPTDIELMVDGAVHPLVDAHARLRLNPGEHHFQISAAGYERARPDVSLSPGEQRDLDVPLRQVSDPAIDTPPIDDAEECSPECRRRRRLGWSLGATAAAAAIVLAIVLTSRPKAIGHDVWNSPSALVEW